jgi:hypothetical protein
MPCAVVYAVAVKNSWALEHGRCTPSRLHFCGQFFTAGQNLRDRPPRATPVVTTCQVLVQEYTLHHPPRSSSILLLPPCCASAPDFSPSLHLQYLSTTHGFLNSTTQPPSHATHCFSRLSPECPASPLQRIIPSSRLPAAHAPTPPPFSHDSVPQRNGSPLHNFSSVHHVLYQRDAAPETTGDVSVYVNNSPARLMPSQYNPACGNGAGQSVLFTRIVGAHVPFQSQNPVSVNANGWVRTCHCACYRRHGPLDIGVRQRDPARSGAC